MAASVREHQSTTLHNLWAEVAEGHLPLLTPERLEQLQVLKEEMTTIEIPAPVHYPPSPPGDIECWMEEEEQDEEEVVPVTPLPPPMPMGRRPELGPDGLPTSFSFACGGWLQFFLFGVARCIKDHGLHVKAQFAGCSAGALAALGLAIPEGSYDKAVDYCKQVCIPRCRGTLLGPFRLAEYVRGCLEDCAGLDGDTWAKANGRLHVAVTAVPSFKSLRVSSFDSREDLITALMASAAAVPFAPPVRSRQGQWMIDGGIADFQPLLDETTVTISPLYWSRADIKPSRYVPAWWAFLPPSNAATVDWLYDLGYCDALRWMRSMKLEHHCSERCRGDPSDLLSCRQRPTRPPHPFDVSTRSFLRFLGYGSWPRIFDWVTMLLVGSLWRSLAFALIYSELFVKLAMVTLTALAHEVSSRLVTAALAAALFLLAPSAGHLLTAFTLLLATKLAMHPPQKGVQQEHWRHSTELLASLFSISLFFRSIPVLGCRIHLRKHHKLFRQSVVYRLCQYII